MKLTSHLIQRQMRLDPPLTRDLVTERDLQVPMPDGAVLLADRYAPRPGDQGLPLALLRSPYGRRGPIAWGMARPLAERGFQVLMQSVRGTFGSGGTFDPLRCEREDGLATLEWVVKQPWFGQAIVLCGMSYLGYAHWAVADQLPAAVKAMIPQVTESALTLEFLREDGLSLETPFAWGVMMAEVEGRDAIARQATRPRRVRRAVRTLPLGAADVAAAGRRLDYIQDILASHSGAPRWSGIDHQDKVGEVTVPVSSVGGWHDIFLPGQLRDFQVLQRAGHPVRLTIGPWTHDATDTMSAGLQETLDFGLACARGEQPPPRPPVRLFVMGEEAWRDFDTWPPEGYPSRRYCLQPGGGLSAELPAESGPDRYRYDPADPTPSAGGVRMGRDSGRVDNSAVEARADVVTYTTAVLDSDVDVIGEVSAQIWFRSSLPHADVFVRLCDVDPRGRSSNVCDGLTSLTSANELACVPVRLWPTAYRFKRGHRIRVQVSSGAFPRYARNPGTGEPPATATTLRIADQAIHHDPAHPSAIILPARPAPAEGALP